MKNKIYIYLITILIILPFTVLQAQTWEELNNKVKEFYEKGDYYNAIDYGEKTLNQAEKEFGKKHATYATSLNNLAGLYRAMGQYEKAEPLYLKALEIFKEVLGENHSDYATSLNNLASLYYAMGQYEKAEPLFLQASEIDKKILGEKHPNYARDLNNLAVLYKTRGQYEKAEPLYLEALKIKKESLGDKHPEYAGSLINLAGLYCAMGQYEKAEPLYLKALEIYKETLGEKHPYYATSLNNLAGLYNDMGQYEKAESLYLKASEIFKESLGEKHPDYASSLNGLALLYDAMEQYEKAEPLYIKASEIFKESLGEKHLSYTTSLINLAALYRAMGQHEKAEPLFLKALEIDKESLGDKHPDYASSLNGLALLYDAMGQYEKAEPLYLKALEIRKAVLGEKHPSYATSLNNLAGLYRAMGQYEKAEPLYLKANDNMLQQFNTYFPGLNEKEKLQFLKTIEHNFKVFNSFVIKRVSQNNSIISEMSDISLSTKGLILSSTASIKNSIIKSEDASLINLYGELVSTRASISKAYTLTIEEQKKMDLNLTEFEEKANNIEKELGSRSSKFQSEIEQKNLTWKDVQNKLSANESAIDFVNFQYYDKRWTDTTFYCALIVKPDLSNPILVQLCTEKDLEQYLTISADNNNSYVRNNNTSNNLYNLIWKPLEQYLNGVNTVYISPSGLLNRVSFYALSNSNNELLTDKYSIRYLTNLKDIVTNKPEQKVNEITGLNASVFGGAVFDMDEAGITENSVKFKKDEFVSRGADLVIDDSVKTSYSTDVNYFSNGRWIYLQGTKDETENIAGLFKNHNLNVTIYTGTNASEDAVKSVNYTNSPTVLHISTHGYFFPEPPKDYHKMQFQFTGSASVFKASDNPLFRSGIILAGANYVWTGNKPIENTEDGILTAYEVSNMDLTNTELVVLSACETGLGDIKGSEGVFGLQRAFKVAGAKSILMSLWKVPDKETSELMRLFYTNWLGGKTKYESLHDAQLEMRKSYDPYYWAAFVLIE